MGKPFEQVQPAMTFAASHLDESVKLEALAARTSMSAFHLHRLFSLVARETPKRFTTRLRLERAAAMLLSGSESILDVALACGFESHEGFTRAFRRRFGMAPTAYRRRGFARATTDEEARSHQVWVDRIGPCIALFGVRQDEERSEMTYSVTRKSVSPQPVLVERRRVSRAEIAATIGEVVGRLFGLAQQEGIALEGHPFTRYVEVGPGLMTIEPGMRVAGSGPWESDPGEPKEGKVRRDRLPGGFVASTIHQGPYETLSDAYAALDAWITSEGLTRAGAPWESYITDPTEHPDPKDWQTEVCWPVR